MQMHRMDEQNTERKTYIFPSPGIACCPLSRIHCACAQHKNDFGSWLSRQLDYESTWILLFFLMFLLSFRFVAPIAMIKTQCERCTCIKSLSIHFCINFLLLRLPCCVCPIARTKRSYHIHLLLVLYKNSLNISLDGKTLSTTAPKPLTCHFNILLDRIATWTFYHDKRFCSACAKFKRERRK